MKHFYKGKKNSMRKQNLEAITQAWALWASLPVLWLLTLLLGQTHHPDLWGWQPLNPDSVFAALMHYTFPPVFHRSGCSPFGAWLCLNMSVLCKQCKHSSVASVTQRQPDTTCAVSRSRRRTERWTDLNTKRKLLAAVLRDSKPSLSVFQNLLLSGCGDPLSLCPGLTGESTFTTCVFVCVLLVCVCLS